MGTATWRIANEKCEQEEKNAKGYALLCARAYIYHSERCVPFIMNMVSAGIVASDAVDILSKMAGMTCEDICEEYGYMNFSREFEIAMSEIEDVYYAAYNRTSVRKEREERIKIDMTLRSMLS
jgi:hypothetical protein